MSVGLISSSYADRQEDETREEMLRLLLILEAAVSGVFVSYGYRLVHQV